MIQAGPYKHIYDPSPSVQEPWYINDHTFIQDEEGLWHMFGITHQEPADALDERFLAHATSPRLVDGQWTRQEPVLPFDPAAGETHVWAPHVIRHDEQYWMFYCGGGEDHSRYRIQLAVSPDLWHWQRHPANPLVVDGYDARDPMVLRVGKEWVMYYTGNSEPAGGHHVVFAVTSRDLTHWENRREVFRHPAIGTYGGPTESPFVVRRNDRYHLFVCTNSPYNTSAVYKSADPFHWEISQLAGEFPSHAAEVVVLENGKTYVSRAGWGQGGLYLAELDWGQ